MDLYTPLCCLCLILAAGSTYHSRKAQGSSSSPSHGGNEHFKRFQMIYLGAYYLMMAGDWLQGPYIYALYQAYNFEHADIARLFVAGFGASMVFGTFIGSLADRMGRKRFCLLYVALYVASCATKHVNSYGILMLGRLLGGIATSLLFSVFDAWLISEHNSRGFDPEWLSSTFSLAILGNSIVAIGSGVAAEVVADLSELQPLDGSDAGKAGSGTVMVGGFCAPFDLAALCLLAGGAFISNTWSENFGERGTADVSPLSSAALKSAWDQIRLRRAVQLAGLISSLFEGSMYTFVFNWTPMLKALSTEEEAEVIPYGIIFATFMMCCMAGSSVFGILKSQGQKEETFTKQVFAIAAIAMLLPAVSGSRAVSYFGFLAFEACVGVYFPAMGTMKSKVVPEAQRAGIYNIFRVPLNIIVLGVLLTSISTETAFFLCALLLGIATVLQGKLEREISAFDRSAAAVLPQDQQTLIDDSL